LIQYICAFYYDQHLQTSACGLFAFYIISQKDLMVATMPNAIEGYLHYNNCRSEFKVSAAATIAYLHIMNALPCVYSGKHSRIPDLMTRNTCAQGTKQHPAESQSIFRFIQSHSATSSPNTPYHHLPFATATCLGASVSCPDGSVGSIHSDDCAPYSRRLGRCL
jgi:hypothetical protein